ncbi:hypothetical protein QYF61_014378 [Mycteria americana]|uniref:Uncharacterized protein n=1 Tax=Mycteria americana TaxID=33587 RepID=A0AAN7NJD3_MYCAM|nr:hypothetical protein QYF61_014378 [Mycteria americana]
MCPEEGTKAGEGLEGMSSEERLKTWGLSSLERRRPRGDLTALYSFLRRGRGEGGPVGMAQSCVRQERFRLDMRKHFFTERVVKAWNGLPAEVVDAPSLSALKRHLDNALHTMLELLVSPEVGPGGAHRPQWLGPASRRTPTISCQGPRGRVSAQPEAFSPCLSDGKGAKHTLIKLAKEVSPTKNGEAKVRPCHGLMALATSMPVLLLSTVHAKNTSAATEKAHGFEQAGTQLPSEEAVESSEVAPRPPSLQTRQAPCPQPLLRGHAFQPFTSFGALLGTHSSILTSFLSYGAQNHTQYSRQQPLQSGQREELSQKALERLPGQAAAQ